VSENRVPYNDCSICSQIAGRPNGDLIARLLPSQPYVRRVMTESDSFAAIPSLGPLAPGHSLLCPRAHHKSFTELTSDLEPEYEEAKQFLRARLSALYGVDVHVFEHGVTGSHTRTLCTVDHAHVHFVPLACGCIFEEDLGSGWMPYDGTLGQLRRIIAGREYIAYESPNGNSCVLAADGLGLGSQYMRKVFAQVLGRPGDWDWRAQPRATEAHAAWHRFVAPNLTGLMPAALDRT
jgi:diadenosine tetraphosphate (Ap4A) HIT family hydrolase